MLSQVEKDSIQRSIWVTCKITWCLASILNTWWMTYQGWKFQIEFASVFTNSMCESADLHMYRINLIYIFVYIYVFVLCYFSRLLLDQMVRPCGSYLNWWLFLRRVVFQKSIELLEFVNYELYQGRYQLGLFI